MDATRASSTLEKLKLFREKDRAIFYVLVTDFWRKRSECVLILGLWLWLECLGFRNFMSKIYSLPQDLMNEIADEAVICLQCMKNVRLLFSSVANEIPLTRSLLETEISLQFFHDNRLIALPKIERLVNELYVPLLADLKAFHEDDAESSSQNHTMMSGNSPNLVVPSSSFEDSLTVSLSQLRIADVSRGARQVNEVPREERAIFVPFSRVRPAVETESRGNTQLIVVPSEERTMVVPFPRGYPRAVSEVRNRTPINEVPQRERTLVVPSPRRYPKAELEV